MFTGYTPVVDEPGPGPKVLIVDRGYDSDAIREDILKCGAEPVIPSRKNRKVQPPIDG